MRREGLRKHGRDSCIRHEAKSKKQAQNELALKALKHLARKVSRGLL